MKANRKWIIYRDFPSKRLVAARILPGVNEVPGEFPPLFHGNSGSRPSECS
jgi:hypothetical protein